MIRKAAIPTPMSQTRNPDDVRNLAEVMQDLSQGLFKPGFVPVLSDLSRQQGRELRDCWRVMPETVRRRVVLSAAEFGEENVLYDFNRLFRVAIDDSVAEIRQTAIHGLWEDESPELIGVLVATMTGDVSLEVRCAAAQELGRFVDLHHDHEIPDAEGEALIAELKQIASSPDENLWLRRRALESVASWDDSEVRDLIELAFESDDNAVRAGAIYAMGRTGSSDYIGEVLNEMVSADSEIRFEAARAAGEIGDEAAIPVLAELVDDDDVEVRTTAVSALGAIGGVAAVRVLRNTLQDAEPEFGELIEAALDEALLTSDPLRGMN